MSRFAVIEITDRDYGSWDEFVKSAAGGTIYHTTAYHLALAEAAEAEVSFVAVTDGGRIAGGAPLLISRSRAGSSVTNRLFLHYNGIMLDRRFSLEHDGAGASAGANASIELISALAQAVSARGLDSVTLHQSGIGFDLRPFHAAGWRSSPTYTYVVGLDPAGGEDVTALLKSADKNIRRLVRKAAENGVRLTEDLETAELHRLHSLTAERKGSPVYLPADRFDRLIRRLHAAGVCRVFQARLSDGTIAAAQVVMFGPGGDSHAVCAAADPRYNSLGVNPFLRFGVFGKMQASGALYNDLTNASLDSVGRFKAELGARLKMNCVLNSPTSMRFKLNELRQRITAAIRRMPGRMPGGPAGEVNDSAQKPGPSAASAPAAGQTLLEDSKEQR